MNAKKVKKIRQEMRKQGLDPLSTDFYQADDGSVACSKEMYRQVKKGFK